MNYVVSWHIDVEADSPEEAAREALRIQRDADSIATVFEVVDRDTSEHHVVDLDAARGE